MPVKHLIMHCMISLIITTTVIMHSNTYNNIPCYTLRAYNAFKHMTNNQMM